MSQGPRVSAFAKRRKLDSDTSAPASDAESQSQIEEASIIDHGQLTERPQAKRKTKKLRREALVQPRVDSANAFSVLAQSNGVRVKGSRALERVDANTVRVRLSHGSTCTFVGAAQLWVRKGILSLYGATLHESADAHTFIAPVTHSTPVATAMSRETEFELTSVSAGVFAKIGALDNKLFAGLEKSSSTFRIIEDVDDASDDHEDDAALSGVSRTTRRVADTTTLENVLSAAKDSSRFLICGKRSATTAAAAIVAANKLVARAYTEQDMKPQNVAVLDLDHIAPMVGPIGTVSVFNYGGPLLTSWAGMTKVLKKSAVRLMSCRWVSAVDESALCEVDSSCLAALLTESGVSSATPLVIRAGSWVSETPISKVSGTYAVLQKPSLLYLDNVLSSPILQACRQLSEDEGGTLEMCPITFESRQSPLSEHQTSLQINVGTFALSATLTVSYTDSKAGVRGILVQGGSLREVDLAEVLPGAILGTVVKPASGASASGSRIQRSDEGRKDEHSDCGTQGDLSRSISSLPSVAKVSELGWCCLGLCKVQHLDLTKEEIGLGMGQEESFLLSAALQESEIWLVLEKPSAEGRFSRELLC